jgi:hypothetical protein
MKLSSIVAVSLLLLLTCGATSLLAAPRYPTPPGETGFLAFAANGIYNQFDFSFIPPGRIWFDTQLVGRRGNNSFKKKKVKGFFLDRYGLDFSAGDISSDLSTVLVEVVRDPREDLTAWVVSKREMVPEGWVVYESYYAAVVVDPAGTNLYGTYGGAGGTHVAEGTEVRYGEYFIVHPDDPRAGIYGMRAGLGDPAEFDRKSPTKIAKRVPYRIRFWTQEPILIAPSSDFIPPITYRLYRNAAWGEGLEVKVDQSQYLFDGNSQAFIRAILSFPLPQWLNEQTAPPVL